MTDKDGNTLLHNAAMNSKPKSVDWIMNHAFGPHMFEICNNEGDTPLEAILINLEATRTRKVIGELTLHLSDKFEGHSRASVLCVARLKGLTDMTSVDLSRLSMGCTCGQCILGFLSPRMCLALLCQADLNYDMLSREIEHLTGPDWVDSNMRSFKYLPTP